MSDTLKVVSYLPLFLVLAALSAQVVGFLTKFWIVGETETGPINHVNLGLWSYEFEYKNGTTITPSGDSPLNLLPEQCLVLAIAAVNTLFCCVVVIKALHVCVGMLAFIVMTLMLLSAFFVYENTDAKLESLQALNDDWPELKLEWSFYLVFLGLVVNISATAIFLSIVLIRGERKAAGSSKGLGPAIPHHDKTPLVSVISDERYAYEDLSVSRSPTEHVYANPGYACIDTFEHHPNGLTDPGDVTVSVSRDAIQSGTYDLVATNKSQPNNHNDRVVQLDYPSHQLQNTSISSPTESVRL